MMDHTPIEALFHHSPNCSCESCRKIIKPYQNGTFVRKEDMDAMNKNIQELIQENSRIQTALDLSNQQKVAMEQYVKQLLETIQVKNELITSIQGPQSSKAQYAEKTSSQEEDEDDEDDSDDEDSDEEPEPEPVVQVKKKKSGKKLRTVTPSLDTRNLFYIGVIIVIVIMVLKK